MKKYLKNVEIIPGKDCSEYAEDFVQQFPQAKIITIVAFKDNSLQQFYFNKEKIVYHTVPVVKQSDDSLYVADIECTKKMVCYSQFMDSLCNDNKDIFFKVYEGFPLQEYEPAGLQKWCLKTKELTTNTVKLSNSILYMDVPTTKLTGKVYSMRQYIYKAMTSLYYPVLDTSKIEVLRQCEKRVTKDNSYTYRYKPLKDNIISVLDGNCKVCLKNTKEGFKCSFDSIKNISGFAHITVIKPRQVCSDFYCDSEYVVVDLFNPVTIYPTEVHSVSLEFRDNWGVTVCYENGNISVIEINGDDVTIYTNGKITEEVQTTSEF